MEDNRGSKRLTAEQTGHPGKICLQSSEHTMKYKVLGTLLAAGLGLVSFVPAAQAEGDAEEGKNKFHSCVGCHGIPGYTNAAPNYHVPTIGGQHAPYIVAALKSYASGNRPHGSMNGNATPMSEDDMQNLAAYITAFKGSPASVAVNGDAAAGKKNSNLETCAACHGSDGNSKDRNNPRLGGQYEDYLIKALKDYKTGARKNPVMQGIAQGLSDQDIGELAAYYASQKPVLRPVSK